VEQAGGTAGVLEQVGETEARRDRALHPWDRQCRDGRTHLLGDVQGAGRGRVGQQHEELLAAVAAGEVAGAHAVAERSADGSEDLVTLAMAEQVVDLLEVVQVEHEGRQRAQRAVGLRDHPLEGVVGGAPVGQARQRVGAGPELRESQVAQVGEHRRGLGDGAPDPRVLLRREALRVPDQHRADDLATDQQGLAEALPARVRADRAAQQRRALAAFAVRPAEAQGHAGPGHSPGEAGGEHVVRIAGGGGLQPVRTVVALKDGGGRPGQRALEVALDELVRLLLGGGHLQGVDELGPVLLVGADEVGTGDHVVQRPAQLGQLVASAHAERPRRHAGGDLGGEGGVATDAGHQVTDQHEDDRQAAQQRHGHPDAQQRSRRPVAVLRGLPGGDGSL